MQIFAIVFLAGVLSGGFGSWKLTANYYQLRELKSVEEARTKEALKLSQAYDLEKSALEKVYDYNLKHNFIEKEVIRYVPKIQKVKSVCNYSADTVRLLNSAADHAVPKTPSVVVDANTASSGVTEYSGIVYTLDILKMYNNARAQCNALIEYVKP